MKKSVKNLRKMLELITLIAIVLVAGIVVKTNASANARAEVVEKETNREIKEEPFFYAELEEITCETYNELLCTSRKLEYRVNGSKEIETATLYPMYRSGNANKPATVVYCNKFKNVKNGDIITYKLTYVSDYTGILEDKFIEGEIVVNLEDEDKN